MTTETELTKIIQSQECEDLREPLQKFTNYIEKLDIHFMHLGTERGYWIYYDENNLAEKDCADKLLENIVYDISRTGVKPFTHKWFRLVARFTREYWRKHPPPVDIDSLTKAHGDFEAFKDMKQFAQNVGGFDVVPMEVHFIDKIYFWYSFMKKVILGNR